MESEQQVSLPVLKSKNRSREEELHVYLGVQKVRSTYVVAGVGDPLGIPSKQQADSRRLLKIERVLE